MAMEAESKNFLLLVLCSVVLVATGLCAFNVVMDPYGLFESRTWTYVNRQKPASLPAMNERLMKSYDVLRGTPVGLILGTSMVDVGLDAGSPAWPESMRPVYNLGLFGVNLRGSYRYLQHVLQFRHVNLVVIGVDFDEFLGRWVLPLTDQDVGRLDTASSHIRTGDLIRTTMSFDALADSGETLFGNLLGIQSTFVAGNHPAEDFGRIRRLLGPTAFFTAMDIADIGIAARTPTAASKTEDLQALLELCRLRGVEAIIVINPVHANLLETYSLLGYWQRFEDWKRDLVSVVAGAAAGRGSEGPVLWDFSGYDKYSTIDPSQATEWFWNSTHYTRRLGDLIIRRLFGRGDAEFGMKLTPDTIEDHLRSTRRQQQEYRKSHLKAVDMVRQLHEEVPHRPPG